MLIKCRQLYDWWRLLLHFCTRTLNCSVILCSYACSLRKCARTAHCGLFLVEKLAKIHAAFAVLSLGCGWSVFWLFSGHTAHCYQARRGISNFLCPVFNGENVIVVTLADGWYTAATFHGRLRHFSAMVVVVVCVCVHYANSCDPAVIGPLCSFQGCV